MAALLALCAAPFSGANASVVLGEVLSQSAIGEPLRVEIRLLGGKPSEVGDCLRLAPQTATADGIATVSGARLSTSGRDANRRLVVTHAQPVSEPIVRLVVDDVCEGGLRRDYTLLLSFPETSVLTGATTLSTAPQELVTEAAPPARPLRPAASRQTTAPAPSERTGIELGAERSARSGVRTSRATAGERSTEAAPRPTPPTPARALPTHDRLVLMGDEQPLGGLKLSLELSDPGRMNSTSEDERELLRREQRLVSALDRSIVAQMELNHRLARLEELQAALAAQADLLESLPANAALSAPAPTRENSPSLSAWLAPAGIFAGLSLLGAALLWRYQRRLAQHSTAREFAADAHPAYPTLQADDPQPFAAAPAPSVAAAPAAILPGIDPDEELAALAPIDVSIPPVDFAPASLPESDLVEPFDEHESAVELADIMLSLGRVRGAAETLAELVMRAPKHSLTPWLKLLKAYRLAGMRTEFETLAGQLNKTFNVQAVTWDEFDELHIASSSVEQMSHILRTLQKLWGTRACQAYLDQILRDNRDGTRQGFPLGVTDDIMTLAGILEDQLGRYTPDETPSVDGVTADTIPADTGALSVPAPRTSDATERA